MDEPRSRGRFRLSGKGTAWRLALAFALTGILIPMLLKLPIWIDYEIVLCVWWVIWLGTLTSLLYTGMRVTDDHQLRPARNWLKLGGSEPTKSSRKDRDVSRGDGGWWPGMYVGEGCFYILVLLIALAALAFALWFLIEVAIPVLLFLIYLVPRGMLAHVVNDRHHCQGRLSRSFLWALIWATVYTVPLAGIVWFVHFSLATMR